MDKANDLQQKLEQMSSQQLAEMIRTETSKEQPDDDLVLLILHTLEKRKKNDHAELGAGERTAWKKYRTPKKKRHGPVHFGWGAKAASFVAIICLLFAAVPQVATAGSIWKILSSYTDAFFEYINIGGSAIEPEEYVFKTDNPGLQQLYDTVVAELGVTEPVVAQWLLDGYELAEITRIDTPSENGIYARFVYEEDEAVFTFDEMKFDISPKYAKAAISIKELEINGIIHSYVRNNGVWLVSWTQQNLKCSIYINCQEDDLINIIKSIYE